MNLRCLLVFVAVLLLPLPSAVHARDYEFDGKISRDVLENYSLQHLTVCDEGDRLAVRFGPLPLFKRRIRHDDIIGVEIGHTTLLDRWGIQWFPWGGWGIHWSPWGGWVWSLSAGKCVVIRRRRGVIRIGTDDAEGLAKFLSSRNPGAEDDR